MCAYQYNTTVNTLTGNIPFFMMYGRESTLVPKHWIEEFAEKRATDATSHTAKLIQILANAWRIAGSKKTEKVSRFNRVKFEVGDHFSEQRNRQPLIGTSLSQELQVKKEKERKKKEAQKYSEPYRRRR